MRTCQLIKTCVFIISSSGLEKIKLNSIHGFLMFIYLTFAERENLINNKLFKCSKTIWNGERNGALIQFVTISILINVIKYSHITKKVTAELIRLEDQFTLKDLEPLDQITFGSYVMRITFGRLSFKVTKSILNKFYMVAVICLVSKFLAILLYVIWKAFQWECLQTVY